MSTNQFQCDNGYYSYSYKRADSDTRPTLFCLKSLVLCGHYNQLNGHVYRPGNKFLENIYYNAFPLSIFFCSRNLPPVSSRHLDLKLANPTTSWTDITVLTYAPLLGTSAYSLPDRSLSGTLKKHDNTINYYYTLVYFFIILLGFCFCYHDFIVLHPSPQSYLSYHSMPPSPSFPAWLAPHDRTAEAPSGASTNQPFPTLSDHVTSPCSA